VHTRDQSQYDSQEVVKLENHLVTLLYEKNKVAFTSNEGFCAADAAMSDNEELRARLS